MEQYADQNRLSISNKRHQEVDMSILKHRIIVWAALSLATSGFAAIGLDIPELVQPVRQAPPAPLEDKPESEPKLKPLTLAMDLVDGSHIIGVPNITSVSVQTPYAKIDVPLKQIQSIKIEDDHEKAFLVLQNGDHLTGVMDLAPIKLETCFGKVSIRTEHLQNIQVCLGGTLSTSLQKGLILHYSFDKDGRGRVTDRSENANHGKVHGAKWAAKGKRSGAYEFDGRDDRISISNEQNLDCDIEDDFTVCAWIEAKQASGAIFSKSKSGIDYVFSLSIHTSGQASAFIHDAGPNIGANIRSKTIVADTGWHHVCERHDSTSRTLTLWVDGVLEASMSTAELRSTSNNVGAYIGDREQGDSAFKGLIDEVMIFNRALSEREVKQLYDFGK